MFRAIDKQKEAAFFLSKTIDAFVDEDENWRYYFNSLVTAARSITLILQKDLRSYYGAEFDLWWEDQRGKLFDTKNFQNIRDLRNILEKEGSRYPLIVLETELVDCVFKSVRVELDSSLGKNRFQTDKG